MNPWSLAAGLLLVALLATACTVDWRERRIPNALVAAGLLAAFVWQALAPAGNGLFDARQPGAVGLGPALLAAALMLVAGLLLWKLRLFGAGDAKLLVAVAAFNGPAGVLPVLLATLLAGGALALAGLAHLGWRLRRGGASGPALGGFPAASVPLGGTRLPYSLAIAAGTGLAAALQRHAVLPF